MTKIKYPTAWTKFMMLHETTLSNCPYSGSGGGSGSIWGDTYNTTVNYNGGSCGFWGGFKTGLGQMVGGLLGGIFGGIFNFGNLGGCCFGGGFGGGCFNFNQLLDPNLALAQTLQGGGWGGGFSNWFTPSADVTSAGNISSSPSSKAKSKEKAKDEPKTNDKVSADKKDDKPTKTVNELEEEVETLLEKDNLTDEELLAKYEELLKAKTEDNKDKIDDLIKKVKEKAQEKSITLTELEGSQVDNGGDESDGIDDNQDMPENADGKQDENSNGEKANSDAAAENAQSGANGTVQSQQTGQKTDVEQSQKTGDVESGNNTSAATAAKQENQQTITALKNLGISSEHAETLADIGVKPASVSGAVTLPSVLSKANLIKLNEALKGTNAKVAAAKNPSAKYDSWICGTIEDINGEDNKLSFIINCGPKNEQEQGHKLGFKYKVSPNPSLYSPYLIDLTEESSKVAEEQEYSHKARKYKFNDGALEYNDDEGETIVYKKTKETE